MSDALPDPRLAATTPFQPDARRRLAACGAEVELVLLPERATRPGRPVPERPAFGADASSRILADETQWRGDELAVTLNRYPFAEQQLIVWSQRPTREHDAAFLAALCAWVDRIGGAGLVNGIGAAASIPRAHAHVTPETRPFLGALRERPVAAPWLPALAGAHCVAKEVPFCLLGVRGEPAARAAAVVALQVRRLTAACNLVLQDGAVWLFPRSPHEIPAPHFPYALGAAEVWGRWCYAEREPFARATAADLERALLLAGRPPA